MILVDTSVWIEFFRDKNISIVERLTEFLENGTVIGLSAVFGELFQGARNHDEEKIISLFWENISKINEAELFIEAGKLSNRYKLLAKRSKLDRLLFISSCKDSKSKPLDVKIKSFRILLKIIRMCCLTKIF